eukprot:12109886-Alexandrium_andersonii.AAC.1
MCIRDRAPWTCGPQGSCQRGLSAGARVRSSARSSNIMEYRGGRCSFALPLRGGYRPPGPPPKAPPTPRRRRRFSG